MKTKIFIISLLSICSFSFSQDGGGGFDFRSTECLSSAQYTSINKMLNENKARLYKEGKLQKNPNLANPLFIWPIQKSAAAPYDSTWSISNYVDHNSNYPNLLQDWNCGTRTYDTSDGYNHQGIDIFTWPFGWYQMDYDQTEVIAAAPGTIIAKSNGNYDRNCAFNSSNWNAVYVQHSDGSIAWYGHLKNNSLTSKPIGTSVAAGEFLGIVGSSGNSTGPHLHFEVYNSNGQLVDPYSGSCNTWPSSTESWWQSQKPYNNPKINYVSTHGSLVNLNNGCGIQESTNFKNNFNSGETVYAYTYLSDISVGTPVNIKLIRPDATVAYNNTFNMSTFYVASYWYWSFPSGNFNQNGTWKVTMTVGSNTLTHQFTYGAVMATNNAQSKDVLKVENPVKENKLNIIYNGLTSENNYTIELYSTEGKFLKKSNILLQKGNNEIPFQHTKGNYLLKLNNGKTTQTFKILKL